ncbi:hypothetical protein C8F04DRAFT_1279926 [Mycena alexandri]|uniref:Uncharacterized protein n=1 Tax=Mycena alexandri TaxID=1745969 RepID=A0AAD6RXE7_9AGAR|nr:hypothetical protein C8F04DRAFT_1279926 [Mycena alexandri]
MATTADAESIDTQTNLSNAGTAPFLSATSQPGPLGNEEGPAPSASPGPMPKRQRVKVKLDADGIPYLLDPTTGTRYDVSDDEDVSLSTPPHASGSKHAQGTGPTHIPSRGASGTEGTLTDASDITPSTPAEIQNGPLRGIPGEDLLQSLVADIGPGNGLTQRQKEKFSLLQGMMSMTRRSLLTSTGLVLGQRVAVVELADQVRELRDELADRIDALREGVATASDRIEAAIEDNVRVLRATGATEAQLASLVSALEQGKAHPLSPLAPMDAPLRTPEMPLDDLQGPIDQALPPRQRHESAEAFQRRGTASLERRVRDAATFTPPEVRQGQQQSDRQTRPEPPPPSILKNTCFDDNSSISSAGRRAGSNAARGAVNIEPAGFNQSTTGYTLSAPAMGPTITVFEVFASEKSSQISRLIDRQLGDEMEAPPRLPKLREPPQYNGDDDDTKFFTWLGQFCTWLQGNALGGPRFDGYRILYLKGALTSHALDWFNSEVEPLERESGIVYEFEAIVCAMHRRFVTSATAVRATKDFEAVRYDPTRGIEYLVSELLRTAGKMREPPADITVRQRFMQLIPASVHNELVRWGLVPEYTDLAMLKNHARSWIEAQGSMRDGGGTQSSTSRAPTLTRPGGRGSTQVTRSRATSQALASSGPVGPARTVTAAP